MKQIVMSESTGFLSASVPAEQQPPFRLIFLIGLHLYIRRNVAAERKPCSAQFYDENPFPFPVQNGDRRVVRHSQRFQPSFRFKGQGYFLYNIIFPYPRFVQVHFLSLV